MFIGKIVLRLAFAALTRAIDEHNLAPALLMLVNDQNDSRRGGVVEKIFGQQQDGLNPVALDKLLANIALAVRASVAAAA